MDKEFFVSELSAHSSMLYRIAYTILRDDDACKDALQDTALKAWEKRDTLRNPQYFRTWATRILINTCYEQQRKRRRVVLVEDVPEPSISPPDPFLDLLIASLPEKQRLVLVLYHSEGMSYAEIASALRLPITTVRSRLHAAREQLRKELAE